VDACDKAARFVRTCDAYGLPLVVLVDTPGFMPGTKQEASGIISRGAGLVNAFAAASVPRFTVVLRKAYGGAYIAMNAKHLGATLAFAWPGAQIGIMDARQAVRIVHRRELAASDEPDALLDALAEDYARANCGAPAAAGDGYVDEVIHPADTRDRLLGALALAG
jgi:acetyl-CoA carboxylase carboxyltransferase component